MFNRNALVSDVIMLDEPSDAEAALALVALQLGPDAIDAPFVAAENAGYKTDLPLGDVLAGYLTTEGPGIASVSRVEHDAGDYFLLTLSTTLTLVFGDRCGYAASKAGWPANRAIEVSGTALLAGAYDHQSRRLH